MANDKKNPLSGAFHDPEPPKDAEAAKDVASVEIKIDLSKVKPNRLFSYDKNSPGFKALVEDIRKNGLKTPITVNMLPDGSYEMVDGWRRLSALKELGHMRPDVVNLVVGNDVKVIDAQSAVVGDILLVRPGDRIPLDGVVVEGESRIDTSPVTGEPVPVAAGYGDEVTSGCVNTSGVLKIRVEKLLEESMVTKILDSVENAAASKPQMERFITRFARIYTPIVVAIALITAIVPSLVSDNWEYWIYTALTFLVIANTTIIKMLKNIMYVGILRSGETRSEIFPELQIVPLDLYERAQELMEARTMHHNEVPFNSKGKALLSGMIYCAHCGSKLVLTTSSGRRAKGEPKRETRIRYACHYKIRHPQDCDGQTGYSGEKLDGIVDKIVIRLFERMKTAPRSQLIQKQREKELQLANSSVANLEKLHAATERELESYKKEIIKTINGTGSFGADILGEMIEETRNKLLDLAQELEQAKAKAADLESSAVAVQKEYDKIMTWADLYAGSSIEGKKMILRQLIDRVNIGKNFEIEVELNISVIQFFDFLHPEGDKSVYYRAS